MRHKLLFKAECFIYVLNPVWKGSLSKCLKTSVSKVKGRLSCCRLSCTCCWHYYDLWSVTDVKPASHKQHAQQFNKRPTLCIKDLTRWQIAIARGTFNPVIVFQSCCPVIYSCSPATVSVLEFLMPYSLSQSMFSHENMTPQAWALLCCMCQREWVRDRTDRTRESEGDRDR